MKPSHFTTPRSQADCQFALNADPIEKLEAHGPAWAGRLFVATGVVAAVGAVVIAVLGFWK